MNRLVIAHAHIFKNAGTTIDWILERNYKSEFIEDRNDEQMRSDPSYVNQLISSNPQIKCFSSHSIPLPVADIKGVDLEFLVMIRHPLLRVRSVYDFERKQKAKTPGAIYAKKASFPEYVEWRMQPEINPTIRDMQVRYLTQMSVGGFDVSKVHLQHAQEFINATPLVGIVEQFNRSLITFDQRLNSLGIDLDFRYIKQNSSGNNPISNTDKIRQLESDLGQALYQRLLDNNQLDLALYDFATKELDHRIANISDIDTKMFELSQNCRDLQ